MTKNISLIQAAVAALFVFCGSAFSQEGKYWTGNGGNQIILMVREPEGKGISESEQWTLSVVQKVISTNLGKFSDITVLDRQKIEPIMQEQKEAMSARYSDENRIRLGELTGANHILSGTVIKTPNAFMLELSVTDLQSGAQKASYSKSVSAASFENHSAMGEAAADLLKQLGVSLTSAGLNELNRAADVAKIQSQDALAKGIVTKRAGTEVAALAYFYQAAALDHSLLEAENRSSVMSVNISSGNIGADTRNKIQWRDDWVARLTEAEQFFDNLFKTNSMPYTLFYVEKIIEGDINYQNKTQTLSINTNLRALPETRSWLSSVEKSLQAIYDGLDSTKMKGEWGLQGWPWRGVTDLRPFNSKNKNFSIAAELINSRGAVIGRANFQLSASWNFNGHGRPIVQISGDDRKQINFANVKADDITDNFTLRIASVNGIAANTAAQTGVLRIQEVSETEWNSSILFEVRNGRITEYNGRGGDVVIPNAVWGETVTSVQAGMFRHKGVTGLRIPDGFESIEARAFANGQLTKVVVPNSVVSIGDEAFANNPLASVTIGANVEVSQSAFPRDFNRYYNFNPYVSDGRGGKVRLKTERKAGTYTFTSTSYSDANGVTHKSEYWNRPTGTIEEYSAEKMKREETAKKIAEDKMAEDVKNRRGGVSTALAVGLPIVVNPVDTLSKPVGFFGRADIEFYKMGIPIRGGFAFNLGVFPRKWDMIKEKYPEYEFIEERIKSYTSDGKPVEIRPYSGKPFTSMNFYIRLHPAKVWYLSGGVGYGAFGGYRANMLPRDGGRDTTEVEVPRWRAAIFPLGTGLVFAPRNALSPFIDAQYSITPLKTGTAGYLSVNFGVKFFHFRSRDMVISEKETEGN